MSKVAVRLFSRLAALAQVPRQRQAAVGALDAFTHSPVRVESPPENSSSSAGLSSASSVRASVTEFGNVLSCWQPVVADSRIALTPHFREHKADRTTQSTTVRDNQCRTA
jgi:hypothetical protein